MFLTPTKAIVIKSEFEDTGMVYQSIPPAIDWELFSGTVTISN